METGEYKTMKAELAGWPVTITSYRMGSEYVCVVDNVDPGAWIARAQAPTREEAEAKALERAEKLLSKTRTFPTGKG